MQVDAVANPSGAPRLQEIVRLLGRKLGMLEDFQTACCGKTFAQCHALVEIGRAGSISLNDLANALGLDKSTMSRTINQLVHGGLVEREIDPEDRRYVTIGLTETGKRTYAELEESMNVYFSELYEAIPEEKREQVVESLDLLVQVFGGSQCCAKKRED